MPASMPPAHVGDDIIISLKENCYPIIDAHETNPDFKALSWAHICALGGQSLQRYYDYDAPRRIECAFYDVGQKLVEWYGVENPYPKPSFSSVHPYPLIGIVRVNNKGYEDAEGPIYPLGVHFGDGFLSMTEGRDVDPILDLFQELGYHFDRSWITLMYNKQGTGSHFWGTRGCSPRVTNDYYGHIRRWFEKHIQRQLKMHISMGDLNNVSPNEINDLYGNIGLLIKEYGQEHFIFPGEVNECRDTFSGASGREIAGYVQRIREHNPDILYALSAFTGAAPLETVREYTAPYQKVFYKHGYRENHYWDKLRHLFSDAYEYYGQIHEVGADHEPFGTGKYVSAQDNGHEMNASMMGLAACMAAIARQSYVYFCSPGIKWEEDFHAQPGFHTVPQLVSMLPPGLCAGTLHHSGTSWRGTRVFEAVNEFRMDGSILPNGTFGYIGYGPGDRIKLPVNRTFTGQIINPETLDTSVISGHAGDKLPEIGYDKGFIITGTLQ